jgi:hypothetical protein
MIIGVEDVVWVRDLFEVQAARLATRVGNGLGDFVGFFSATLTGVALATGLAASAAWGVTAFQDPPPILADASETRFATSRATLYEGFAQMRAGLAPTYSEETLALATRVAHGRRANPSVDVDAWANKLAMEVSDIDD